MRKDYVKHAIILKIEMLKLITVLIMINLIMPMDFVDFAIFLIIIIPKDKKNYEIILKNCH